MMLSEEVDDNIGRVVIVLDVMEILGLDRIEGQEEDGGDENEEPFSA